MNKNTLTLGLALAILGVAAFLIYVRRFEAERAGGEPVQILIAKRAIPRGKTITDAMLDVRSVPVAYVEDRAIRAAERDKVVGLRISNTLSQSESLMWSDFASEPVGEARDLSGMVTPGYRAVYVRAMREDQGATLVRPGDYVDVIATMLDSEDGRGARRSVVLVQKAMVLANGMRTSSEPQLADPDDRHPKSVLEDHGLTLNLTLRQAQTIALAATHGFFTVALRSTGDERTFTAVPPVTSVALLDPKARVAIQSGQYDPAKFGVPPDLGDLTP
ncbi:MAG TPA: Flp pilus assembly protein CpaB [Polyangiaceae bacterium]